MRANYRTYLEYCYISSGGMNNYAFVRRAWIIMHSFGGLEDHCIPSGASRISHSFEPQHFEKHGQQPSWAGGLQRGLGLEVVFRSGNNIWATVASRCSGRQHLTATELALGATTKT